jgi:hypothetical protein
MRKWIIKQSTAPPLKCQVSSLADKTFYQPNRSHSSVSKLKYETYVREPYHALAHGSNRDSSASSYMLT